MTDSELDAGLDSAADAGAVDNEAEPAQGNAPAPVETAVKSPASKGSLSPGAAIALAIVLFVVGALAIVGGVKLLRAARAAA